MKKLAQTFLPFLLILLNSFHFLNGYHIQYKIDDPGRGGFDGSAYLKINKNEIVFSSKLKQRETKKEIEFNLISKDSLFIQNIIQSNDTLSDTLYTSKGLTNLLEVIRTELDAIEPENKNLAGLTQKNEYTIVTKDVPIKIKTAHTYSLSGKPGILTIESKKGYLVKDLLNYLFIYPAFSSAGYIGACIGGTFDAAFTGKNGRVIKFVYKGLEPLNQKN